MSSRPAAVARHRRLKGLRCAMKRSHKQVRKLGSPWWDFHLALERRYELPCRTFRSKGRSG